MDTNYESIAKELHITRKTRFTLVIDSSVHDEKICDKERELARGLFKWILDIHPSHEVAIFRASDKLYDGAPHQRDVKLLNLALGQNFVHDKRPLNVPKCIEELKDELLKFLPDDLNFKNTVIFITGSEFHSYGEDIETIIKADKLDAKFFTFFMGNSPSDVESWKTSNDIPNQIIVSKMVCEIPKFIETLDLLTLVCPPPRCIGKNHESLSLQLEFKKKREGVIFEVLYRQKDDKNDLLRTFNTTTFILDGLQPETEYSIRVRLIDKNKKKSPFTSPLTQKTLRINPLNENINSKNIEGAVATLMAKLKSFKLPEKFYSYKKLDTQKFNVLMVGRIGAGKSSFINTINSIVEGEYTEVCPACSSNRSYTKETRKVFIGDSILLWDIFGVSESNYQEDMLVDLLSGKINSIKENEKNEGIYEQKTFKDKVFCNTIHGIIYTIQPDIISNSEAVQKNIQILNIIKKFNIPIVVVMTQTDKILGNEPSTNVFKNLEVINKINTISSLFSTVFEKEAIIPCINYTSGASKRDLVAEYLALTAIYDLAKKMVANSGNYVIVEVVQHRTKEILGYLIFDDLDVQLKDVRTKILKKFQGDDRFKFADIDNFIFVFETLIQCDLTEDQLTLDTVLDCSNKQQDIDGRLYIDYYNPDVVVNNDDAIILTAVAKLEVYCYENEVDPEKEGDLIHTFYGNSYMQMKLDEMYDELKINCEALSHGNFQFLSPLEAIITNKGDWQLQDIIRLSANKTSCIKIKTGTHSTMISIVDEKDLEKGIFKQVVDANTRAKQIYEICKQKNLEIKHLKYWVRDPEKKINKDDQTPTKPMKGFETLSLVQMGKQEEEDKFIIEIAKKLPGFNSLCIVVSTGN